MVVLRELTLGGMQLGQLCPLSLHVLDELDLLVIAEPASACTRCLAMATRSGRRSSLSSLAMAGIAATCRGGLLPHVVADRPIQFARLLDVHVEAADVRDDLGDRDVADDGGSGLDFAGAV